jgi:hypothetical protein
VLNHLEIGKPDIVSLGSGEEVSLRDLLEQIRSLVGCEGALRWDVRDTTQCLKKHKTRNARVKISLACEGMGSPFEGTISTGYDDNR